MFCSVKNPKAERAALGSGFVSLSGLGAFGRGSLVGCTTEGNNRHCNKPKEDGQDRKPHTLTKALREVDN